MMAPTMMGTREQRMALVVCVGSLTTGGRSVVAPPARAPRPIAGQDIPPRWVWKVMFWLHMSPSQQQK
ncbi:hypothetical protein ACOMHN_049861 [Nucella lapillus]